MLSGDRIFFSKPPDLLFPRPPHPFLFSFSFRDNKYKINNFSLGVWGDFFFAREKRFSTTFAELFHSLYRIFPQSYAQDQKKASALRRLPRSNSQLFHRLFPEPAEETHGLSTDFSTGWERNRRIFRPPFWLFCLFSKRR